MTTDFHRTPDNDSAVIEKHSKSFSLAARLLPIKIRDDVKKLYAWCRWCDDAVDDAANSDQAVLQLTELEDDVRAVYSGRSFRHPATAWLASLVDKYNIPCELPLDLIRGMKMDVEGSPIETTDELELYCYRAAGTVGLMMCHVMGVTDRRALEHAKSLGIAMQLTNISRDIREDWDLGRRYIPESLFAGDPRTDTLPANDRVRPAVISLLRRADRFYRHGFDGLRYIPRRARFAIRIAGLIYREIGQEIRRRNYVVMNQRVFVPAIRKLAVCLKGMADEFTFRLHSLASTTASTVYEYSTINLQTERRTMKSEAAYLVCFALSLTFIMATTLFIIVGINPKETSYEALPWLYSGICAFNALVTGLFARRIAGKLEPAAARDNRQ